MFSFMVIIVFSGEHIRRLFELNLTDRYKDIRI
jgi:hypothetical protein